MPIRGNGVLSLPSEPGTVPKAPGVRQLCGSAASSSTEKGSLPSEPSTVRKAPGVRQRCGSAKTGPRPKVLKVATSDTGAGGQPNTKSACTEQTNTKDSEAPEASTSPEDLAAHARETEPDVAELDTQALDEDSAEKTVPLKP